MKKLVRTACVLSAFLVLLAVAAAAEAGAVTVTLGRPTLTATSALTGCTGDCKQSVAQLVLTEPGARVASPGDGQIVAWRVIAEGTGGGHYICPRVIHPAGSNKFTDGGSPSGAGEEPSRCNAFAFPVTDGTANTIAHAFPIGVGDFVGIDLVSSSGTSQMVRKIAVPGSNAAIFTGGISPTAQSSPTSTGADEYMFNADVQLDPPAISSVSPSSGAGAGGNSVTIAGQHLANASSVTFGGSAATITSNADDSIVVTAPAHSAGDVAVQVSVPGGTATGTYHYTVPAVTGVSPASGPDGGGTAVTITGTDLAGATAVSFGAAGATMFSGSDTSIVAVAPPGAGTVDVRVTTPSGESAATAADHFTYAAPDTIAPVIAKLKVAPGTFKAANIGGPVAAAVGGRVSYSLSEAARVTFTVERGSKKHKRTVWKTLRGSFSRVRPAGGDKFVFTGRLRGRPLGPGHYRLVAAAKDAAGNKSRKSRAPFTVKR
jgi:hypothetical protein